jgi:molybdopterin synthase catalytic subunit
VGARSDSCEVGAQSSRPLFEIVEDDISVDEVVARLADPANGAIVTFVGVVRCETDGREVLYLEYEAYPEMAVETLRQVAGEVQERWPEIREAAIVHRVGRLMVGETAVVIALSAAHRRQVFDALHYAIDRLKEIVPIWKKEVWVESDAVPRPRGLRPGDGQSLRAEWKSEQ